VLLKPFLNALKLHNMEKKMLQYNIHNIRKASSYINSIDALNIKSLEEEKIAVQKGFQIGFNKATGILTIIVLSDFLIRAEENNPIKLFGTVVNCEFMLKDYEDTIKQEEDGRIDFPNDLIITLLSVSYSTARGIIASFTAGTEYQNIFLPLVNIQEFKDMLQSPQDKAGQ
jgi:hypothetical protein